MKFIPKSAEEIASRGLLPPGMYRFSVLDAEDQVSKNNNEQIKLTLRIKTTDGNYTVFDYLLEKMDFKLRHFCEYNGLLSKYDSGTVCAKDCLDVSGMCEIFVQEGKEKYDGGKYPDRNSVRDYCPAPEGMAKEEKHGKKPDDLFDQDIPF